MPADNRFVVPNPRDKQWEPAPTKPALLAVVLAFLCAPALLGAGGYGYLWATGQTVKLTAGELPRLAPAQAVAVLPAQPRPSLVRAQAPAPSQLAPQAPPMPVVQRPSSSAQAATRRAANGHFYFDTVVNGAAVPMVFDTGASVVVLRWEDAIKAGVNPGSLDFNICTSTANGVSEAAFVSLGAMRIGNIVRSDVPAVVMRRGKLGQSLLGQSFMGSLAGYQLQGDRLVLNGE